MTRTGFPHSEISGSKPVCGSPKHIAAYHVLHRLLTPSHPPQTLRSLTLCLSSQPFQQKSWTVLTLKMFRLPYEIVKEQKLVEFVPPSPKLWRRPGSNRRPSTCKADALPTELRPLYAF